MKFTMNLALLALITLATACGGGGSGGGGNGGGAGGAGGGNGGGGSGTTSNQLPSSVGTVNGTLVDSPVIGLTYTTASTTAVTGAGGSFTCQAGDDVTFKVGSIVVGKSPCLPVITPVEIATLGAVRAEAATFSGGTSAQLSVAQNNRLRRLATLLQTLDSDGDTTNGISVGAGAEVILQQILTSEGITLEEAINDGDVDADWSQALVQFASSAGGSYSAQTSASAAVTHLNSTLAGMTVCTTANKANSATVTGYVGSCVAVTCNSGYTVTNGSCVSNATFSMSAVVAQLDTDFGTMFGKTFLEGSFGAAAIDAQCRNTNGTDLYNYTGPGDEVVVASSIFNLLYDRANNDYTTRASAPDVVAAVECAETVVSIMMESLATSNPTLRAQLLASIGAADDSQIVDPSETSLSADELAILDLLILHFD